MLPDPDMEISSSTSEAVSVPLGLATLLVPEGRPDSTAVTEPARLVAAPEGAETAIQRSPVLSCLLASLSVSLP